jgi:hypothetical protein
MNLVLRVKLFLITSLIWTAHPKEWTNLNASPANRIVWKENQVLNWDNFKGKAPNSSSLVAETNSGIHFGYTCSGETMDWNIYAYFDQELSWRKPNASKSILMHEKLHFDISELYARKLRKRLHLLKHPCSLEKVELQKIFNEVVADHKQRQKKYDLETKHSLDSIRQIQWNSWVEQELSYLDKFKK